MRSAIGPASRDVGLSTTGYPDSPKDTRLRHKLLLRGRHRLATLLAIVSTVLLTGCSATGVLNTLTPGGSYTRKADVAYGTLPRQKLDIYPPTATKPAAGWPAVVFFYGGSWNSGARADYQFVAEALAARGVLTLVADYRLYPQVRYPDFLIDSAQALYLKPLIGHLFLCVERRARRSRLCSVSATWTTSPNYPPDSQPIEFASAQAPRSFLGAAPDDDLVNPQRNTQQLASKLQAAGVPVTLQFYPRTNHLTLIGAFSWPLRWLAPVVDDVQAFIAAAPPAQSAKRE